MSVHIIHIPATMFSRTKRWCTTWYSTFLTFSRPMPVLTDYSDPCACPAHHGICPKPGSLAPCPKPGSLTPCPERIVFARSLAFACNTPCPVEQSMHAEFVFSMATYASVPRADVPVSAHRQIQFAYVHIIHIKNSTPAPAHMERVFRVKAQGTVVV